MICNVGSTWCEICKTNFDDKYSANFYLFKVTIEIPEKDVKYVQI